MYVLDLTLSPGRERGQNLTILMFTALKAEEGTDTEPIGGTFAKLSNYDTAGKAVCSKLREFTAHIMR